VVTFASLFLGILTLFPMISTDSAPVAIKGCEVAFIENDASYIMGTHLQFTNGVTVTVTNLSSKSITAMCRLKGVTYADGTSWSSAQASQ
jgi:hypothetical protein